MKFYPGRQIVCPGRSFRGSTLGLSSRSFSTVVPVAKAIVYRVSPRATNQNTPEGQTLSGGRQIFWPVCKLAGSISGLSCVSVEMVVPTKDAIKYSVSPGVTIQYRPEEQGT
ncbi:hypothetical protein SPSYN_00365 [Sporotomaculum syntrophicum]|uniref:Uncharacterized protein n=1 Tax=Sporotomaculum syntrophicum TaxID=182264 RepID=A0A9D2WTI6_9FIRM|nr:hypothetical protein SPSYN_00365 [Sporotomaculum syntrophicum]